MTTTTDQRYIVRLNHRNGGTTVHDGLTLDEARNLATRSIERRKAQAAVITDTAGTVMGQIEAAA